MTMVEIEERLRAIEARITISELRSRYCWHTTRGSREDVVALFTNDCIFQNARNEGQEPIVVRGREALLAYLSRMQPGRRIPMVMNEVTRIHGAIAEGTCVMQSIGEDQFCGHYVDEFRKLDGRWLFSSRRFYPYWPLFKPDLDRHGP